MLAFQLGDHQLGAASAAIQSLQTALVGLAQASGRPAINPGPVDGILGDKTMLAVAAGLQAASERIPKDTAATVVSAALVFGATTSQAKTAVTTYASQLTVIIKAATAAYATGLIKNPSQFPIQTFAAQPSALPGAGAGSILGTGPWYKTWWGMGAIVVGAFFVYRFLAEPSKAA